MLLFWAARADVGHIRRVLIFGHFLRMSQCTKDFTHMIPFVLHSKPRSEVWV